MSFAEVAANLWDKHQWVTIPLAFDTNGKPKRPITKLWTDTPAEREHILGQPWEQARGIGVVLGAKSHNLAVIDVDDTALSDHVMALILRSHLVTRTVSTVSKRLHVYFYEESPSGSTRIHPRWKGRDVQVELKASGTQVATPTTPGYQDIGYLPFAQPMRVPSIADAWRSIAARLGVEEPYASDVGGDYPKPWKAAVGHGERNRALYVEAHRLREARMPLEDALEVLRVRYEQHYEQGDATWRDAENTIKSAYRKGPMPEARTLKWQL